jgi:hypothetical protein
MCSKLLPTARKTVLVDSTTEVFFPTSDWIPCADVDVVNALIQLYPDPNQVAQDQIAVRPCYQTAQTDTRNPNGFAGLTGDAIFSETRRSTNNQDISSATTANCWVRFGIGAKAFDAAIPVRGEVLLTVAYRCA